MIRAVLCVIVAVALLAASAPAIADARHDATAGALQREFRTLERTARTLVATNDAGPTRGARSVVTLRLPQRRWSHAGVAGLTVVGRGPDRPTAVTWRTTGGRRSVRRFDGVRVATPGGKPVSLSGSGRRRLVLTLDGTARRPVVTVRPFKGGDANRRSHARVVLDRTGPPTAGL